MFCIALLPSSSNTYGIKEIDLKLIGKQKGSSKGYYNGFFPEYNERLHLKMFLTYPNQLMRSYEILEIRNLNQQNGKTIATIDIQAIEILQRRPKEKAPCHENWRNYDNELIEQLIKRTSKKRILDQFTESSKRLEILTSDRL